MIRIQAGIRFIEVPILHACLGHYFGTRAQCVSSLGQYGSSWWQLIKELPKHCIITRMLTDNFRKRNVWSELYIQGNVAQGAIGNLVNCALIVKRHCPKPLSVNLTQLFGVPFGRFPPKHEIKVQAFSNKTRIMHLVPVPWRTSSLGYVSALMELLSSLRASERIFCTHLPLSTIEKVGREKPKKVFDGLKSNVKQIQFK